MFRSRTPSPAHRHEVGRDQRLDRVAADAGSDRAGPGKHFLHQHVCAEQERISGENPFLVLLVIAPPSQALEAPANPATVPLNTYPAPGEFGRWTRAPHFVEHRDETVSAACSSMSMSLTPAI